MGDLKALELRLEAILDLYRKHLETATIYKIPVLRRRGAKSHDWFAGVQPVDDAVKFNFLPMHDNPGLIADISPTLKRHKTGASVFRFTEIDERLFAELEGIVAGGFLAYMNGEPTTAKR